MTIDQALRILLNRKDTACRDLHAAFNRKDFRGDEYLREGPELQKEYAKKHVEYLVERDKLIREWPNRVELLTHPNKDKRALFLEILKYHPERMKHYRK